MRESVRQELGRYVVAVTTVAAALGVSLAGRGAVGVQTPYFLFASAVVASALRGGLHVGLFATVLSSLSVCYFILHPIHSFELDDPADALVLLLFTGEGIALSLLVNVAGTLRLKALRSAPARYSIAVLAVLVAFLLKTWTGKHHPHDLPFVLFYTAVLVAVWCGGTGPGLLAMAMSAGLAALYTFSPDFAAAEGSPQLAVRMAVFLLEGTIITLVGTTAFAARLLADEAERRVREQAALLDQARDAILAEDAAGRVTYWSRGAERLYGWTRAEALGMLAADLLGADAPPGEWSGELRQRTRSGAEVVVESRRTPVAGGCLVLNSDITERKNLELQLLRAQRLESIGSLASGIAHDLGNILSPIHMGLSILRRQPRGEDDVSLVEALLASADRGILLVRQVVGFVRGEEKRARVDIEAVVAELCRFLRHALPKDVEVTAAVAPALWPVRGDPTQLYQILLNLCVNARDAMPSGGTIALEAENVSGARRLVRLRVRDTGCGIPEEMHEKVFEAFFTTKGEGKGTGLGLSTTRALVERLGGSVSLTSEVGVGTTFTVDLPAADASAGGIRHLTAEPAAGRGELVVVAEEEASIRELARRTLEAEGYRVAACGDAAGAMEAVRDGGVRLVVVSARLPGAEFVLSEARGGVLVTLAGPAPAFMRAGAAVLKKPYDAAALLVAVREALAPPTLPSRPG